MTNRAAVNAGALNAAAASASSTGRASVSVTVAVHALGQPSVVVQQTVSDVTDVVTVAIESRIWAPTARATASLEQVVHAIGRPALGIESRIEYPSAAVSVLLSQPIHETGAALAALSQSVYSRAIGQTLRWRPRVVIGGVDVTARLTGQIRVEAEESTARIAELTLAPGDGQISADEWTGKVITIDIQRVSAAGALIDAQRLFTGRVDEPVYDPRAATTEIRAGDGLPERLDAMSRAQIDAALPGGRWSAAVYGDEAEGWEYAQQRLETLAAGYDLDAGGAARLAPWAASDPADFVFSGSQILDASLSVSLTRRADLQNRIDVAFDYRYRRDLQQERSYSWYHPKSFCDGAAYTKPNRQMIGQAIEATGWTPTAEPSYGMLPPSGLIRCGTSQTIWVISDALRAQIAVSARFGLALRYSRTVTERYELAVRAPQSIAAAGERRGAERGNISADAEDIDWSMPQDGYAPPAPGAVDADGVHFVDRVDGAEDGRAAATAAIETLLARARRTILASHRANTVTCQVLIAPYVERHHTVEIDHPAVQARGKVRHLVHTLDIDEGTALTEITLALSRGGAGDAGSPMTAPSPPATYEPPGPPGSALIKRHRTLPSRFGGEPSSPPYDDAWEGYTGNVLSLLPGAVVYGEQVVDQTPEGEPITEPVAPAERAPAPGTEVYPERFAIPTDEISREPIEATRAADYVVAIPQDLLVLA